MTDLPSGATGLLAGAISYALRMCALIVPGELALPTPCADWDLARLLRHLSDSMADLETAIRTGHLDPEGPPGRAGAGLADRDPVEVLRDPVEVLRDRAAELLCASYGYGGPDRFVAVGGLPVPAGLVACTGAVEIAVHGWDVSAARGGAGRGGGRGGADRGGAGRGGACRGGACPIPAPLATRMLRLCPLLAAGREGLFAGPVEVPAQASPGDRLVGYLGRHPG